MSTLALPTSAIASPNDSMTDVMRKLPLSLTRFAAMADPMLPSPMKPILIAVA